MTFDDIRWHVVMCMYDVWYHVGNAWWLRRRSKADHVISHAHAHVHVHVHRRLILIFQHFVVIYGWVKRYERNRHTYTHMYVLRRIMCAVRLCFFDVPCPVLTFVAGVALCMWFLRVLSGMWCCFSSSFSIIDWSLYDWTRITSFRERSWKWKSTF